VDSVAAAEHEGPPAPTRTPTRNGDDDDDDDNVRPDGTNGDGPMDDVLAGPGRLGPLARLGPQSSVLESRRFDGRDTRGPARRKSRLDIAINGPLPTHYLSRKKIGSPGDSKKLQFALFSRRIFQTAPRLGRRAAYLVRIYSYASAASIWGGKVEVVSACPFWNGSRNKILTTPCQLSRAN
jgi:hypothetical protein